MQDLDNAFAALAETMERDDDDAASRAAVLTLARIVLTDLRRIADALDHIGRNLPPK